MYRSKKDLLFFIFIFLFFYDGLFQRSSMLGKHLVGIKGFQGTQDGPHVQFSLTSSEQVFTFSSLLLFLQQDSQINYHTDCINAISSDSCVIAFIE